MEFIIRKNCKSIAGVPHQVYGVGEGLPEGVIIRLKPEEGIEVEQVMGNGEVKEGCGAVWVKLHWEGVKSKENGKSILSREHFIFNAQRCFL